MICKCSICQGLVVQAEYPRYKGELVHVDTSKTYDHRVPHKRYKVHMYDTVNKRWWIVQISEPTTIAEAHRRALSVMAAWATKNSHWEGNWESRRVEEYT